MKGLVVLFSGQGGLAVNQYDEQCRCAQLAHAYERWWQRCWHDACLFSGPRGWDAEESLQVELSGRPKLSSNSSRIVRLIVCVNEPGFICSADGSTSGDSCPSKTKFVLAIWLRLSWAQAMNGTTNRSARRAGHVQDHLRDRDCSTVRPSVPRCAARARSCG